MVFELVFEQSILFDNENDSCYSVACAINKSKEIDPTNYYFKQVTDTS